MTRNIIIIYAMLAGSVLAFGKQQQSLNFSRYDLILSRRPFGGSSIASGDSPAESVVQAPVDPENSFIKDYQMCAIRDSLAGVSVGLVNLKAKPVLSFFLFEGDEIDGVYLVEADFTEEKALLRKDGDEQWISMSGVVRAASLPRNANYSDNLSNVQSLITSRLKQMNRRKSVPFTGLTKAEYAIKRANGEIPPPQPARNFLPGRAPQIDLTREERDAKLRKYNMDLIRSGGQNGLPLPITLTKEEDDQLVEEGVLPSRR